MLPRPCLRSRETVLPQQVSCSSVQAAEIAGSLHRFLFCSYRISNDIKELEQNGVAQGMGRLSAIHFSSSYRDQLKLLMDDLGGIAGYLAELGLAADCAALDDLLDQCNTLESLWNIVEIFSINSGSHCYFEMIQWLQNSIEMTAHISMDEHYDFYRRCAKPEISHLEHGGPGYTYWDDVNALALRGRLSDVWELLQLHSEVRSVVEYTSSAEDRQGLADLQEIFVSHPIRLLGDFLAAFKDILGRVESIHRAPGATVVDGFTAQDEASISGFMRDFSSEWMRWHALVSRLRRDPHACPLLHRMPQMQTVLHVLTGDPAALAPLCTKYVSDRVDSSLCWQQFALCKLIYSGQTPPPFSKPIVVQVIEDALDFQAAENRRSGVDGGNIAVARLLQKVLGGHIIPVLKFMYELSMKTPYEQYQPTALKTSSQGSLTLVSSGEVDAQAVCGAALLGCALVTASVCAHLLLVLDRSEIVPSRVPGERWGSHDAESLLEEMLLEFATRLNVAEYPLEMVSEYLSLCPTRGASVARVILPQRVTLTDADAVHVADTLRDMGLSDDAQLVETCRGMEWVRRARAATSKRETSALVDGSLSGLFLGLGEPGSGQAAVGMLTRAATFFIRSQDRSRLCALFDAAISAVAAAQVAAGAAADRYTQAVSAVRGVQDYECLQGMVLPAEAVASLLQTSGDVGAGVATINNYASKFRSTVKTRDHSGTFVSAEAEERLKEAVLCAAVLSQTVRYAKRLLDAVDSADVLHSISMAAAAEGAGGGSLGLTLARYLEAVELVLHSLALLSDRTAESSRVLAACALKKACQLLVSLISKHTRASIDSSPFSIMTSVAPPRFQLFIIDLCIWTHDKHAALLLRPRNENGQSAEDDPTPLSPVVFSRKQIEDLLCAFHQNTDVVTVRLARNACDATTAVKVEVAVQKLSSEMRPSIMNLFLSGLIQTNEVLRSSSAKAEEKIDAAYGLPRSGSTNSVGSFGTARHPFASPSLRGDMTGLFESRKTVDASSFFHAS